MLSRDRQIRKFFQRVVTENKDSVVNARLGNLLTGELKDGVSGKFYATLVTGQVIKVVNHEAPSQLAWPVRLGKVTGSNILQVIGTWDAFEVLPQPNIPAHSPTQQWPGVDTLWVRGEQILPGLFVPYSGLIVQVYGFVYFINGSGFHQLANQTIDLTAQVPSTGARYVLVEVDADGVLQYTAGTSVASRELLAPEDIPIPSVNYYPLVAVKTYAGQTQFLKDKLFSDFADLRWTGYSSGASINLHWADLLDVPVVFPPDTSITDLLYVRRFDFSDAPTVTDDFSAGFLEDDMWHDTATGKFYLLHDQTTGAAVWVDITASGGGGGGSGLTLLDLSAQVISGGETHFDLVDATEQIAVYINGLLEMPSNVTLDVDGLGFTLAFGVVLGDNVTVVLGATVGGGHVIQDNGTPMTARSNLNFIGATLTDNSGADSTDITITGGGSSVASNLYMSSNFH